MKRTVFLFLTYLLHSIVIADEAGSTSQEENIVSVHEHDVHVRMELWFDENPQDISIELRGPLPLLDLVAHTGAGEFQQPNKVVDESHTLTSGGLYYLFVSDAGRNGIDDGFLRISAYFEDDKPITLVESSTSFEYGRVWTFLVPAVPIINDGLLNDGER